MFNKVRYIKAITIIIMMFSTSIIAKERLYIEPAFSLVYGKAWQEGTSRNHEVNYKYTQNGLGFFLRLGYNYNNFIAGLDMNYNMLRENNNINDTSKSVYNFYTGPVLGIRVPKVNPIPILPPLILWVGYNFYDRIYNASNPIAGSLIGSSMKIGLGLEILKFLNINIEGLRHTYSKNKTGDEEIKFPGFLGDVEFTNPISYSVLISASLSITIF